jgi:hypothetical protein
MFDPFRNKDHNDELRHLVREAMEELAESARPEQIHFITICYSHSCDPMKARTNALLRGLELEQHLRTKGVEILQVYEEKPYREDGTYTGHSHSIIVLPEKYVDQSGNQRRQYRLWENFKWDYDLYDFVANYHREYARTKARSIHKEHAIRIDPLHSKDIKRELGNIAGYATKCLTKYKCPFNNSFSQNMRVSERELYLAALRRVGFLCMTKPSLVRRMLAWIKGDAFRILEHARDVLCRIFGDITKAKYEIYRAIRRSSEGLTLKGNRLKSDVQNDIDGNESECDRNDKCNMKRNVNNSKSTNDFHKTKQNRKRRQSKKWEKDNDVPETWDLMEWIRKGQKSYLRLRST